MQFFHSALFGLKFHLGKCKIFLVICGCCLSGPSYLLVLSTICTEYAPTLAHRILNNTKIALQCTSMYVLSGYFCFSNCRVGMSGCFQRDFIAPLAVVRLLIKLLRLRMKSKCLRLIDIDINSVQWALKVYFLAPVDCTALVSPLRWFINKSHFAVALVFFAVAVNSLRNRLPPPPYSHAPFFFRRGTMCAADLETFSI